MKTILKMRQKYVSEHLLRQSLMQVENMAWKQRIVKYSYIIGRVKAMKGRLLHNDMYLKLLKTEISEIASFIKESEYKEDVYKMEMDGKYNGIDIINRALGQNLALTLNKLIEISQDEAKFMITEYLNSCEENNDDAEIERYYLNLKKAAVVTGDKIFLHFLRRDIDVKNIKTLFKAKSGRKDKIYLISGGSELKDNDLDNLASLSFNEFVAALKKYSYWKEIVNEEGKLESDIEASLDSYTLVYTQYMSKCYPLSILPIIDYILRKKAEINNIKAILWGKEKNLSQEEIITHLVI